MSARGLEVVVPFIPDPKPGSGYLMVVASVIWTVLLNTVALGIQAAGICLAIKLVF